MNITFQLGDIPRILPEVLLIVLALMVFGSDILERWGSDEAAQLERSHSAASLTALGLGMIFVVVLLQSGYVYRLPTDTPVNFLTNILRNLQSGGPRPDPIMGIFATDHLTTIGRLIFIGIAGLTTLLTMNARPISNPGQFYALMLLTTVGLNVMSGASELILAFLAVELTAIPLTLLAGAWHTRTTVTATERRYVLFSLLASGLLLLGSGLVYGYAVNTGTASTSTRFAHIAQITAQDSADLILLTIGMICIVLSMSYKIAVAPFHSWSPAMYQASSIPITAWIVTAARVAVVFLFYRLLVSLLPALTGIAVIGSDMGWTALLALLALLMLLIGNLAALRQTSLKHLLTASSMAHAGFALLALIIWVSPLNIDRTLGTSALIYYLVVYSLATLGAFGVLAIIVLAGGSDELAEIRGLAQRNRTLAAVLAICLLSLAGMPPLAGFLARFQVLLAIWQAGAWWLVIVALLNTILALYLYLRVLTAIFLATPATTEPLPVPRTMQASLIIAVLLISVPGIYPNLLLRAITQVQALMGMQIPGS